MPLFCVRLTTPRSTRRGSSGKSGVARTEACNAGDWLAIKLLKATLALVDVIGNCALNLETIRSLDKKHSLGSLLAESRQTRWTQLMSK